MDAAGLDAGQLLDRGDGRAEGVPVERIAVQRLGVQQKLAAFGLGDRRRHRDLAAELVGYAGLAFADAFNLGRVQAIDLVAALAGILVSHAQREIEQRAEARRERVIAGDLAAEVADDAAEPDAQELEPAPCSFELMGMAIAADHDPASRFQPADVHGPSEVIERTPFEILGQSRC
jgi:hypothetical protein